MRTLLLVSFLLISLISLSQPKYPIQTMYKGDSVVILSIKQSFDINKAIETQKRVIREQSRKITLLNKTIDSLNNTIVHIPFMLDSIKYVADTTYKWADELNMILWEYATYGSFIYTIPPYNKLYFVNLDDYNLYTHDYGNVLVFEKFNTLSSGATDLCALTARSFACKRAYFSVIRIDVQPQSFARSTSAPPLRSQLSTNV